MEVSESYNFNHPRRGTAVIICNAKFSEVTGMKARAGAENDCKNLKTTFRTLGFDVKEHMNLTATEILKLLKKGMTGKQHIFDKCRRKYYLIYFVRVH